MKLDRLLNAILFLSGSAISLLWVLVLIASLSEVSTPYGQIGSTDPILSGPYGQGSPDRFTANEVHVLNHHMEKLLQLLEEIRGRIGD